MSSSPVAATRACDRYRRIFPRIIHGAAVAIALDSGCGESISCIRPSLEFHKS